MPSDSANRHLLFGILAVQLDFVSRDALFEAMQTWVLAKSRTLEEILLDQNTLSAEPVRLLQALIDEHVRQHQGDPAESLRALDDPSDQELINRLAELNDSDLFASLSLLKEDAPHRMPLDETTRPVGRDATPGRRFRILRPHAAGGLGQVYIAEDEELHREVALKELRDHLAHQPESRARFVLEAEITGGLEHPGIVPVYGLGHYDDGRPFYAMRFIRGDSLQTAIARFHAPESTDGNQTERAIEFQRLLRRFLDVCNAVHYAHRRGVLHRDLKPGNIMLGEYGETLVVDWGLAKPLGTAAEQLDSEEQASRGQAALVPHSGSDMDPTELGSAVGTPAYMSPEQAQGRLDQLGPATDVYSLGATLYALLTGRAPISGDEESGRVDAAEVLERVLSGTWPRPRAVNSEVPKPVEAVCLKAMALEPRDRYLTARDLANDIERFLADESVAAYSESWSERTARWARKHRTWVRAGIASLLIVAAVATLAAILISQQQRIAERLAAANEALAVKEKEARLEAEQERGQAESARVQAEAVVDYLVNAFRRADPDQDGRTVTVAEVLDQATRQLQDRKEIRPLTRAALLDAIGTTYLGLGLPAEALTNLKKVDALRSKLLGDAHPLTLGVQTRVAAASSEAGDSRQAVDLLRQVFERSKRALGAEDELTLTALNDLALALGETGRMQEATRMLRQVADVRRKLLGETHPLTLESSINLALLLQNRGEFKTAIPLYEKTLEKMHAADEVPRRDVAAALNNLAGAYDQAGRNEDALRTYESALDIMRDVLGDNHPDTLATTSNLATAHYRAGRYDQAAEYFREAHRGLENRLGKEHPAVMQVLANLAVCLSKMQRRQEALLLHEDILQRQRASLGDSHPDTLTSMNNVAIGYLDEGRFPEAISLMEETLRKRRETLGEDHPETLLSEQNLAKCHERSGQIAVASQRYRSVLEKMRRVLGDQHPHTLVAMSNMAGILLRGERPRDALPLYDEAYQSANATLGPLHPYTLTFKSNLGTACVLVGEYDRAVTLLTELRKYFTEKGQTASPDAVKVSLALAAALVANDEAQQAVDVLTPLLEPLRQQDPPADDSLMQAFVLLGEATLKLEDVEAAAAHLKEAAEHSESATVDVAKRARALCLLGVVELKQGDIEKAERDLLAGYQEAENVGASVRGRPLHRSMILAAQALIDLFRAEGRTEELARWEATLAALREPSGESSPTP